MHPVFKLVFLFLTIFLFYLISLDIILINNENSNNKNITNGIVNENFFIIDSNNLEKVQSHMYGFSISKKGILTDNYYKQLGHYEVPDPQGVYVMIRKNIYEIELNQDFDGNFGII